MASPRLSTAGMTLQYAVETSAGTRPTTGYTKIPEVKSMPSFNPSPNTIDSTTLEETEYMTYVQRNSILKTRSDKRCISTVFRIWPNRKTADTS